MAKIKIKDPIDHIRSRPSMYIGLISRKKLLQEVVDNIVDETFKKKMEAYIEINGDKFLVKDTGPGIINPFEMIKIGDDESSNGYTEKIKAIFLNIFSSGKYDEVIDDNLYNYTIGTHGLGLKIVNALSKETKVYFKEKNKNYIMFLEKGKFIKIKETEKKETILDKKYNFGIEFIPDPEIFVNEPEIDYNDIIFQLDLCSIYNGLEYTFVINGVQVERSKNIIDFFKKRFDVDESEDGNIFFIKKDNTEIIFTYDLNKKTNIIGNINFKETEGPYLKQITSLFYNKKDKISLTNHLLLFVAVSLKNTEVFYQSQSKEKSSYSFDDNKLNYLKNKISKILTENEWINNIIYPVILNEETLREIRKIKRKEKNVPVNSNVRYSEKKEILYIVEGISAGGTICMCRRNNESVLPVMGKISNVLKKKPDKDLQGIIRVLEEKWEKIILICDPDPDGSHIVILLTILLYKYFPDLLKKTKIVKPPLWGKENKGKYIFYYEKPEGGGDFTRFKGLGEFTYKQMRIILDEKSYYKPINENNIKELINKYNIISHLQEVEYVQ